MLSRVTKAHPLGMGFVVGLLLYSVSPGVAFCAEVGLPPVNANSAPWPPPAATVSAAPPVSPKGDLTPSPGVLNVPGGGGGPIRGMAGNDSGALLPPGIVPPSTSGRPTPDVLAAPRAKAPVNTQSFTKGRTPRYRESLPEMPGPQDTTDASFMGGMAKVESIKRELKERIGIAQLRAQLALARGENTKKKVPVVREKKPEIVSLFVLDKHGEAVIQYESGDVYWVHTHDRLPGGVRVVAISANGVTVAQGGTKTMLPFAPANIGTNSGSVGTAPTPGSNKFPVMSFGGPPPGGPPTGGPPTSSLSGSSTLPPSSYGMP